MGIDRQQAMRGLLDGLLSQNGITAASVITRDGLLVMDSKNTLSAPETFSAMTAALMGAAETAFYELGGTSELRVTAESKERKMVAVGATEQLLLVLVSNGSLGATDLIKKAQTAAVELRKLLGEG